AGRRGLKEDPDGHEHTAHNDTDEKSRQHSPLAQDATNKGLDVVAQVTEDLDDGLDQPVNHDARVRLTRWGKESFGRGVVSSIVTMPSTVHTSRCSRVVRD